MNQITARQSVVLETIRRLTREQSYPPSRRELGRVLGISTHSVDEHLGALIRKGYLARRAKYGQRNIVVLGDVPPRRAPEPVSERPPLPRIPVCASLDPRVVVGEVARPSCAPEATAALVMRDDALAARGILCGDWLLVDENAMREIRVGALVVVRFDDGAVVRALSMVDGLVRLCAEAGAAPFMLRPEDFRRALLAVVVGVFRDTGAAAEAG